MRRETLMLGRFATPVGEMLAVTDADGAVRALDFVDFEDRMRRLLARHWGEVDLIEGPVPDTVAAAFDAYFAGDLTALERLAVKTGGTSFQRDVWAALRRIPAGTTVSYGRLAAEIGRPKAVRAAGLANGRNPVAVIVPCHRVIGADGSLTGYAGGIARKRALLAHEGARIGA